MKTLQIIFAVMPLKLNVTVHMFIIRHLYLLAQMKRWRRHFCRGWVLCINLSTEIWCMYVYNVVIYVHSWLLCGWILNVLLWRESGRGREKCYLVTNNGGVSDLYHCFSSLLLLFTSNGDPFMKWVRVFILNNFNYDNSWIILLSCWQLHHLIVDIVLFH